MSVFKHVAMLVPLFKAHTKRNFNNHTLSTKLLENNFRYFHTIPQQCVIDTIFGGNRYEENQRRISRLNEVIDYDPKNTKALLERASHYISIGENANACKDMEAAIETGEEIEDLHNVYVRLYLLSESPEKKSQMLEKATDIVLNNPKVMLEGKGFTYLCVMNHNSDRFERAVQIATIGIEFCKDQPEEESTLLSIRGSILVSNLKQLENGFRDFDRALELDVSPSARLFALSTIVKCCIVEKLDEQIDKYVEMILEEEKRAEKLVIVDRARKSLNEMKMQLREYYFSRKEYLKPLKIMSNKPTNSIEYSEYQFACLLNGDFHSYIRNVEYLYNFSKHNPEFITLLNPKQSPYDHVINNLGCIGLSAIFADDVDMALKVSEQMRILLKDYKCEFPHNPMPKETFEILCHIIISLGNLDNPVLLDENALAAKHYPTVYENLAMVFSMKGNIPKARECKIKYYNITQDVATLCDISAMYIDEKEYEKSIRECEKVLKIDPTNCHALYNIGESLFHLGNLEKAKEYFEQTMCECEKQNYEHSELLKGSLKELWPEYSEIR